MANNNLTYRQCQQLTLEEESIQFGVNRYRQQIADGRLGDLAPGMKLTAHLVKILVPIIEESCEKALISYHCGASQNISQWLYLNQFPADVLALITASEAISAASALNKNRFVNLSSNINRSITSWYKLALIKKASSSKYFDNVLRRYETYTNDCARIVFLDKILEDYNSSEEQCEKIQSIELVIDRQTQMKASASLAEMVITNGGVLQEVVEWGGKGSKSTRLVSFTEEATEWIEEMNSKCELLKPRMYPMLCKPDRWSTPFDGGFLSPIFKDTTQLIKTNDRAFIKSLESFDMPKVYRAINAVQETPWSVNEKVLEAVKFVYENDWQVSKVPPSNVPEKPAFCGEDADVETRKEWNRKAHDWHRLSVKLMSKRCQHMQKIAVAEKMLDYDNEFYFVHSCDFRGRIYPNGQALNPQGDDVAKGLLKFYNKKPMGANGDKWLFIHIANSFGIDKVSFTDRIRWVHEHFEELIGYAEDYKTNTGWVDADSPFVALAACFELKEYSDWISAGALPKDFLSSLPVSFDGTCNGLQHFSAMIRDLEGGKSVGLVPSDEPSDIYTVVATATNALLYRRVEDNPEDFQSAKWAGKLVRKDVKRNVMTTPYAATQEGRKEQIKKGFADDHNINLERDDVQFLEEVIYEATQEVVASAAIVMGYLKGIAKVCNSHNTEINWISPSGFPVKQAYKELDKLEIRYTFNKKRHSVTDASFNPAKPLRKNKQVSAVAPNFVHSYDAAHLVLTVNACLDKGVTGFALVHDSYGTHAGDAELLNRALREEFVGMYQENILQKFHTAILNRLPPKAVIQVPPVPTMGTLNLDDVHYSEYFFA